MSKKINPKTFIKKKIREIKIEVGNKKALVAISGGVDSFGCMVLANNALGKSLKAVFLDDGLMRQGEPEKVKKTAKQTGINLEIKRVSKYFFKSLKGITDPEKKRKAFRKTFYQTLGKIIRQEKCKFLIQGTIAADIIGTKKGIKTQHNVLGQIGIDSKKYGFKVIEPIKELYKPQVRLVARTLGLPREVWQRMPFPGPGLSLRVIGEATPRKVGMVRKATEIVEKRLEKFSAFQYFAVLLNDKATGMRKGKRAFGNIIVVRSVDSQDAMTAEATKIPLKILFAIQKEICQKIPLVIKVLYDLTPKPPSTIEYI